jgi:hypothetical protein
MSKHLVKHLLRKKTKCLESAKLSQAPHQFFRANVTPGPGYYVFLPLYVRMHSPCYTFLLASSAGIVFDMTLHGICVEFPNPKCTWTASSLYSNIHAE